MLAVKLSIVLEYNSRYSHVVSALSGSWKGRKKPKSSDCVRLYSEVDSSALSIGLAVVVSVLGLAKFLPRFYGMRCAPSHGFRYLDRSIFDNKKSHHMAPFVRDKEMRAGFESPTELRSKASKGTSNVA